MRRRLTWVAMYIVLVTLVVSTLWRVKLDGFSLLCVVILSALMIDYEIQEARKYEKHLTELRRTLLERHDHK